ncbi:MAG: polyprenyl synthetase family protein [Bdellovibrionales bacterium]|nr:polyprenyl synthetase family protein [Bdellovibrionales bacterium]
MSTASSSENTTVKKNLTNKTSEDLDNNQNNNKSIPVKERITEALNRLSGLKGVEEVIKSKLTSDARLLEEIPNYLLELGGKRLRPVICLLMAKLLGMEKPNQELLDVAAGIELIHMATLLHDDIIDNSPLRRHKESPYLKYGLSSTLLAGDFLLVRAFSLCALLDDQIVAATETACIELTEGEILETPLFAATHSVDTSINIAKKKTASLFRLACFSAAHIVAGNEEIEKIAASFGENIGIAFQILDDILDVTSTEDLLGKKSGIDIQERKPSIVNVLWLESDSQLAKRLLQPETEIDQDFIEKALLELKSSAVITKAKSIAIEYADLAKKDLNELLRLIEDKESETFFDLLALVDFVLERLN